MHHLGGKIIANITDEGDDRHNHSARIIMWGSGQAMSCADCGGTPWGDQSWHFSILLVSDMALQTFLELMREIGNYASVASYYIYLLLVLR